MSFWRSKIGSLMTSCMGTPLMFGGSGGSGGDVEGRPLKRIAVGHESLDVFLEKQNRIVDDVLHGNTVDVRRQRRLWWGGVKGRSGVESRTRIEAGCGDGANRNGHIVLRKRCSRHRWCGEFFR